MLISLIVPCYNEEESLPHLYSALCEIRDSESEASKAFEFIFVNDGSKHRSPYSQQTPFNLLGASKCILSLDPWHNSGRKGIISSLQMRKLRLS